MNKEEKYIFDIFKNFDHEYDKYIKNKIGLIHDLFQLKKIVPKNI